MESASNPPMSITIREAVGLSTALGWAIWFVSCEPEKSARCTPMSRAVCLAAPQHFVALQALFASADVELRYVRHPVTGIRSPSPDRNDSIGSSEPRVKGGSCTEVHLLLLLANAGWDVGSIAALLNELVQSEDSKRWDASTLGEMEVRDI